MRIPTIANQSVKHERSQTPRASMALADTGEKEMWRGIGRSLGVALDDVSRALDDIDKIEAQTELNKLQSDSENVFLDAFGKMDQERDYSKYQGYLDEAVKQVDGFEIKNPKARKTFQNWINNKSVINKQKLMGKTLRRKTANIRADNLAIYNRAIESDSPTALDDATRAVKTLLQGGVIGEEEATNKLAEAQRVVQYKETWKIAAAMGFEEGSKWLADPENAEGLNAKDRQDMIRSLKFFNDQNVAAQKAQLEQAQAADNENILRGILDSSITPDDIMQTSLDTDDKLAWIKELEKRTEKLAKGKKVESDPDAKFDVSYKVMKGEISSDEIYGLAKKGKLSIEDAEKYVAKLDKDVDPVVKIRKKAVADELKKLHKSGGIWGGEGSLQNTEVYTRRLEQLDEFFEKNPDASDKELEEFKDLLTKDIFSNTVGQWLQGGNNFSWASETETRINEFLKSSDITSGVQKFIASEEATIDDEPQDVSDFKERLNSFNDEDEARAYYEKWISKFES